MNIKYIAPILVLLSGAAAFADESIAWFEVDSLAPGRVLPNVQKMLVRWQLKSEDFSAVKRNEEYDVMEFAEYAEIMGATGGNPQRDCFKDPKNREVLDDYDFSKLVSGCHALLKIGLKPYVKLGNVPQKFSSDINLGAFGMNIRPPLDYDVYDRYMTACAKSLLEAFGREELLKWRFAVLTEFENFGWFKDLSGSPEKTFKAYCRLYEVTVDAFSRTISPDLFFGVHAMACTEGQWDERWFIRYAAEHKLPLKFVTASFYDTSPGKFTTGFTLPQTVMHLRKAAESVGLTNLIFGVDEGRILCGKARGTKASELNTRVVGDTYQAAYDARLVKQMFDNNIDYFAAWGYYSGPHTWFEGLPSVSFHVARESAKFKDMRRLSVKSDRNVRAGLEVDAVAALSKNGKTVRFMAYSFTNKVSCAGSTLVKFAIKTPAQWRGQDVTVTRRLIDDNANWFDEWRKERKLRSFGNNRFNWSPDDPAPCANTGFSSLKDRELFRTQIEPKLADCARLKRVSHETRPNDNGMIEIECILQNNTVVFFELSACN